MSSSRDLKNNCQQIKYYQYGNTNNTKIQLYLKKNQINHLKLFAHSGIRANIENDFVVANFHRQIDIESKQNNERKKRRKQTENYHLLC